MKIDSDTKFVGCGVVGIILVLFLIVVAINGPAGLSNAFSGWRASAFGSDWLIVQYAQDGSVIKAWDIKDSAVANETDSDGIFFTTPNGVVHLSGHYIYVQNPTTELRNELLKVEK